MQANKILLVLLLLLTIPAFALEINTPASEPPVPQWEEFCPVNYENPIPLKPLEIEKMGSELAEKSTLEKGYCSSTSATANIIRGITVLPAFACWSNRKLYKFTYDTELNRENERILYWQHRKKQFERQLATCNGLSTDAKAMCYLKVRELQEQINHNKIQQVQNNILIEQNIMHSINERNTNLQLQNIYNSINKF